MELGAKDNGLLRLLSVPGVSQDPSGTLVLSGVLQEDRPAGGLGGAHPRVIRHPDEEQRYTDPAAFEYAFMTNCSVTLILSNERKCTVSAVPLTGLE